MFFAPPIVIPTGFFIAVTVIVNAILKYKLQKRIIDSGTLDETVIQALVRPVNFRQDSLRWGLLLLFGGTGLVVLEFVPYQMNDSSLPYGIEAIALSLGFLVYYILVRRTTHQ